MKISKKRRMQNKTDYNKRLHLLKGEIPRLVLRKTNKYLIAQYVESKEAQDKVLIGINSKELIKHGWPKERSGSLKSLPAAYLTGFLFGKKIEKSKLKIPILDLGMARTVHGSRLYAFAKGVVDAGVKISHDSKVFPKDERIHGKHTKEIPFKEVKSKIEGK
ncbi:MAG: 50S ribosomal protein L18 [Nanoarchaeota archaeon]